MMKILMTMVLCVVTLAPVLAQEPPLAIGTDNVKLSWDPDRAVVLVQHARLGRMVVEPVGLTPPLDCVVSTKLRNEMAATDTMIVSDRQGGVLKISLMKDTDFIVFGCEKRNLSEESLFLDTYHPMRIGLEPAASSLKVLGTGGLTDPDKTEGSYSFLAAAEPKSRQGIVAGWLTHGRGSGVFFSDTEGYPLRIMPRLDYGGLIIPPNGYEKMDFLAVGFFDDARLGLEAYADLAAYHNLVQLKPQPSGYCTWYSERHGGASNERALPELAAYAEEHLQPYGLNFIQIDDYWQGRPRQSHDLDLKGKTEEYLGKPEDAKDKWWWGPHADFTTHDLKGPYKSGMKATADTLKEMGYTPGIWLMPFAWDPLSPPLIDHQDWMVHRPDGSLHYAMWSGWALDMTHPEAHAFLRETITRITQDWGYDYLKLDGLWAGMATDILYVNNAYKDDDLGGAVFHNETMTPVQAYRAGLHTVRDAAGDEVYILGCNVSQNMRTMGASFGLVDAMRIGPDNGSNWKDLITGPWHGTNRYFFHNRVWHNDPDPVYVREKMPLEHARLLASWIGITGQLTVNSDWLPVMPEERLDILRKILPAHGKQARPVDLFERDFPNVWLLDNAADKRYVVGVFNWSDKEALQVDYSPEALGIREKADLVGYDFWADTLTQVYMDQVTIDVPPASCKVIALRPLMERPFVLSTNRHVKQGIGEMSKYRWDADTKTLYGESDVVAGDAYEMRIYAPDWKAKSVKLLNSKSRTKLKRDGALARITITPEESGAVQWRVSFKKR